MIEDYFNRYMSLQRRVHFEGASFRSTSEQKEQLRARPMRLCPTCKMSPGENRNHWVSDHRPPVALEKRNSWLLYPQFYPQFYPQCCRCSATQKNRNDVNRLGRLMAVLVAVPEQTVQQLQIITLPARFKRHTWFNCLKKYNCLII